MTDIRLITSKQSINQESLRHIPHEQLAELAKYVNRELKRRFHAKETRGTIRDILDKTFGNFDHILQTKVTADTANSPIKTPARFPAVLLKQEPQQRMKYFKTLIAQDWGYLWRGDHLDDELHYCVYAHTDPSEKMLSINKSCGGEMRLPFYIGKGTSGRAYDLVRNQGHGARLRSILECGHKPDDIVHIIKSGLSEAQAFELEAKLIYFFGTIYDKAQRGCLLNLDHSLRPAFACEMVLCQDRNQNQVA